MVPSASIPAVRQNRSKLTETASQALPTAPIPVGGEAINVVLTFFMALLSFVDSTPRAYRLKASNAAPPISTFPGAIPAKAFLCFVHGRSGPAQSHRGRTPALHIAGDATHGPHHIFDDVGAGQRAPQLRRKTEPAHCEDFIQALEDAF